MITLIVGTQTGTAEFVADDIVSLCQSHNLDISSTLTPEDLDLDTEQTWLFCTSTHGAGELPDNLKPFETKLATQSDLSKIRYMIIALGDSSYDTYCQAGKILETLLESKGAVKITETFNVDAMNDALPEDIVLPWLEENLDKFSQ